MLARVLREHQCKEKKHHRIVVVLQRAVRNWRPAGQRPGPRRARRLAHRRAQATTHALTCPAQAYAIYSAQRKSSSTNSLFVTARLHSTRAMTHTRMTDAPATYSAMAYATLCAWGAADVATKRLHGICIEQRNPSSHSSVPALVKQQFCYKS
jgi:hypothetical protein